ncbi:isoleucine--tRNA ligase [Candidatus Pacearchaeota archaeon]|nr:isoleucine--tRNA ligase [Candidatus Pacearchaeota archaeon]
MYKIKKVEEEARKVWKKYNKEIEKAVQNNPKKPLFSFLEGPPTANAPPALHHLEGRTFKDLICKFKYMQGFSVPRKGGWDCHGLPVEVQIEKKLDLKDKKAIIDYGVDKFIKKARDSVWSNIDEWNKSTKQLAYWVDLKNPYVTLENEYIESVWWSLKELYKKKMLYEGHKVVPFCPRCGTPLSSHEVAQGYKDITEESVYIAFKLKNKKGEYILAWTTTPWTLPGNVALAVGKDIDYVKVELPDKDKIIIGKERLDALEGMDYKIVEKMKGKDLVGLEYEPLYDIKETQNEKSHKVIPADFVTTEDGTGIVHTAVMYGEDDYRVGKKIGLPAVHTVGEDGKFLDITPKFLRGRFVKEAEKDIKKDLKKRHLLVKTEKTTHTYPFCWRCDSPLLYYGIDSWFIKVSKVRDKLLKLNNKINWVPDHLKEGRFGKWLEGAKDWALSRFKFWGTPLPVWKCGSESCGKVKVIGSIKELKNSAIKIPKGDIDLHKPWIDKIKIKCECGDNMERIPDVIDCWYDSGSASFAQFHYPFENKEKFEKRFPYDFIAEGIDQTRGWFYTLHVLGTLLFNKPAYKNVISMGHVVDENGEKMSKSKGNIIVPSEIIEKAGVDAVRLQFCTSNVGSSKRFSFDLIKEQVMPFLTILFNLHKYYGYQKESEEKQELEIEDKWILSRLNSVIRDITKDLEEYSLDKAFKKLNDFVVNDFSRNYVKMTRDRNVKKIIGEILEKISLLAAPFAPYISEYIYQTFSDDCVHLSEWPKSDKKKINEDLEKDMELVLKAIELGLAERDRQQIGLKWPLASASTSYKEQIPKKFKDLIKNQLNIKELEIMTGGKDEMEIELDTKMTPELEAEGYARNIIRRIQASRKKLGLKPKDEVETILVVDEELKKMLDKKEFKKMIQEVTNSKKLEFVTTLKETFKNKFDFKVKNKKGEIVIINKK